MTKENHPDQIDLEEAIAKEKRAARRKAQKKSTSVLLPLELHKMKNGELVDRIETWLEHMDTARLIEESLQFQLECIQNHIARRKDPRSPEGVWIGYGGIKFHAETISWRMKPGSREDMAEYKKTLTLPEEMWGKLMDVAVDLGISFGEAVRIAVTHTYLVQNDDGTFRIEPSFSWKTPSKGPVADHSEYRRSVRQERYGVSKQS